MWDVPRPTSHWQSHRWWSFADVSCTGLLNHFVTDNTCVTSHVVFVTGNQDNTLPLVTVYGWRIMSCLWLPIKPILPSLTVYGWRMRSRLWLSIKPMLFLRWQYMEDTSRPCIWLQIKRMHLLRWLHMDDVPRPVCDSQSSQFTSFVDSIWTMHHATPCVWLSIKSVHFLRWQYGSALRSAFDCQSNQCPSIFDSMWATFPVLFVNHVLHSRKHMFDEHLPTYVTESHIDIMRTSTAVGWHVTA